MMYPLNEESTMFIIDQENFCYRVMPFGLKNVGDTYQMSMDKVFSDQIGRNVKVYVDDMVVKTKFAKEHSDDLIKIFQQLRKHNMRLSPKKKCDFRVQGGNKFLEFMIACRGVETNPNKCDALPIT
uniref:Retrovirus-related Pol polyprotein from transposon 17.6 n=1 Tax=Cajanus cajan TaxID=3821 RepID=A0A151T4K6_CAJCA|nr:Retrovirus-related Pol polyprotein from transposon 17.6 [Cajanus cajan]